MEELTNLDYLIVMFSLTGTITVFTAVFPLLGILFSLTKCFFHFLIFLVFKTSKLTYQFTLLIILNKSWTDGNASFLRAARSGNTEKLLEYLKGNIDVNTSNNNGLNALHLASKEGHQFVVAELLKNGADVNAATKKGNTALHIAALAGQKLVVVILLENGAKINVQSQNGFTPLYMAAQENHDDIVRLLLDNGANQNIATEDGFTPLAVALQQGHNKVVSVLLEDETKGKVQLSALHIAAKKDDCRAAALLLQEIENPDVTSVSGFTPLHITAHYGNKNMALMLLEKGANVNLQAKHQITPLHVAAKWGKINMVALLLEKGAKLEAATRDGLTPLHCAARNGQDHVVNLLVKRGSIVTAKTKNGLAPLHMTAQGDHVDCARILLNNKAPVDDVTVDSLTASHVSAHCGNLRVAKLLLDCEADPNARALNGFTPLHIACKKNRLKVVELLLDYGASIKAATESGLTPLHVASLMGYVDIVIALIRSETDLDIQTLQGETPLHLAIRANQTDIVRILLHNGAEANARAKEAQTPLHIAARLKNVNIISALIQHGAEIDATTKELYTALHIAAKEGQEEVASILIEHGASLSVATKKGFTPLHLAAKYGNVEVARLLLQRNSPVDAQDNNGLTPLHVAVHYDYVNMALLLLEKGASPHSTAKNGFTPLHVAAKKNQMDIATTLLEYGAKVNVESKAGFMPLHLAAQCGHTDMVTLLIEHQANVNAAAKNGLMPLHLCAQEDHVKVAAILVRNGADIDPQTKAGYTPLHVASHFGQVHMVQFLLQHSAIINSTTAHGYTPLHQAAQQGHTFIITLLLEHKALPNTVTNLGQTPLSIAQQLGYVSVVEILKAITELDNLPIITMVTEEKYTVVSPEIMQEEIVSDSEDEEGEHSVVDDQLINYIASDGTKSFTESTQIINITKDEKPAESLALSQHIKAPVTVEKENLPSQGIIANEKTHVIEKYVPNDANISGTSVFPGKLEWKIFLVSFMVDARGGAMRGCRHSGVRIIIPPQKALMPIRITCRYLQKDNFVHPPPLMEGEALASRILEVGPSGTKFQGPVILEIPHFASLHEKEREITILRSDSGETWKEHISPPDANVYDILNGCIEEDESSALEDLNTNRITRIVTMDFPRYFAIVTRFRRDIHTLDPKGGTLTSTVVPQVQAVFTEDALTKTIHVGLQVQPIPLDLVPKMMEYGIVASPIVTVEPRRRKFHRPITLTIPLPLAATNDVLDQTNSYPSSLRLLCSITGRTSKSKWEDVTWSTPLSFINGCVSFTTSVSARFWLLDYRQSNSASKYANELYQEVITVPFMAKVAVFTKQSELQVFCITDDKEENVLEIQKHYIQIAVCTDVEVLEGKPYYLEFFGNLAPVTNVEEKLCLTFQAFRENKLSFFVRAKDPLQDAAGRIVFMREPKSGQEHLSQTPVCDLYITLPDLNKVDAEEDDDVLTLKRNYKPQEIEWSETDKCDADDDILQNNSSTSTLTDQEAYASEEVDHIDHKEFDSKSSNCRLLQGEWPDNFNSFCSLW
ncbi:uncharacterized protein LOC143255805 isoform X3 [Tachypleus tridentatus]|uniref:uncharacterized protein LOC143255805 isoform X3 n=1 Tax=Tachypleus tridentatus TaxID=6853 RepID=UPI003FD0C98F